ncbi:hypothetical protein Cgig2_006201 [Carnegiea gigantea]|uniref:RING-type E3 ubiquitin transferase n=1 Tax=Carnegiea gigantea TaxID=171969 RepID=A0A9Q1KX03_9CARY|nr:hypothetical protein Cgig2_006201 [Carnegiea gigantea]
MVRLLGNGSSLSAALPDHDPTRHWNTSAPFASRSSPTRLSSKAGHTFDRICVQVCQNLSFTPTLSDGTRPDFSTQVFPNLALQSAIPNWCSQNGVAPPSSKDYAAVEKIVRGLIEEEGEKKDPIRPSEMILINGVPDKLDPGVTHPVTELTPGSTGSSSTRRLVQTSPSSPPAVPLTPLPLKTRPACWSCEPSSSSSETLNPNPNAEEDEFIGKFESSDPFEQEKSAISLRKSTRNDDNARISLCTPRLLQALRPLLNSGYEKVQMNAIAALVNLSREKQNKIKIVRAGIVPMVIDLLKGRLPESQEHAAGMIFSLSIEDDNKTTLGFLGAFPHQPSQAGETRRRSAVASGSAVGERQKSPAGGVQRGGECGGEGGDARQQRGGAAGAAAEKEQRPVGAEGAAEVLKDVADTGSERGREKARQVLVMLKGMQEDEEDETLASLESGRGVTLTRHRLAAAGGAGKSSLF